MMPSLVPATTHPAQTKLIGPAIIASATAERIDTWQA